MASQVFTVVIVKTEDEKDEVFMEYTLMAKDSTDAAFKAGLTVAGDIGTEENASLSVLVRPF